jgi:protein-L-isoaspartate(D-aspartate) O-methyltransferase
LLVERGPFPYNLPWVSDGRAGWPLQIISETTYEVEQRRRMVEEQLRARGIRDERVLEFMGRLPRQHFIPPEQRRAAYEDQPVLIGWGQTISQPYIVALMTESLELQKNHRVLEVGAGSGYQTAILAELAQHVYAIEILAALAEQGRKNLEELGVDNVTYLTGDGRRGWPEPLLFDRILVAAAGETLPEALPRQLAEGGRLVAPVGGPDGQELVLLVNDHGKFQQKFLCYCRFVRLTGDAP